MRIAIISAFFATVASITGCLFSASHETHGHETSDSAPRCIVGAQVACACPGDTRGTMQGSQLCFRDGTFSDCECPVTPHPSRVAAEMPVRVDVLTPATPALYHRCGADLSCRPGLVCAATLAIGADHSHGERDTSCTAACPTGADRDCPGYTPDARTVACLVFGRSDRAQCFKTCTRQSDCAPLGMTCVIVDSRQGVRDDRAVCVP